MRHQARGASGDEVHDDADAKGPDAVAGGVFFAALEDNGHVYAYVLNKDETVVQIADIDGTIACESV